MVYFHSDQFIQFSTIFDYAKFWYKMVGWLEQEIPRSIKFGSTILYHMGGIYTINYHSIDVISIILVTVFVGINN